MLLGIVARHAAEDCVRISPGMVFKDPLFCCLRAQTARHYY